MRLWPFQRRTDNQPTGPDPTTLREQVETQKLRLESAKLTQQLKLYESITDSVFGTPVNFAEILSYRGMPLIPLWFRDIYQAKGTTTRLVQDYDRIINTSRFLLETNANAQGLVYGMRDFVISSGLTVSVIAKKRTADDAQDDDPDRGESDQETKTLVRKVQKLIDDFRKKNRVRKLEQEHFVRKHRDGNAFLRIFPEELETPAIRYIEPFDIRPPKGADWEGDWSFGIKTTIQDTQTVLGFNINWPRTNEDEFVPERLMCHAKINCSQNQKKGQPSLYCLDDELRGSQKLRYAVREGAKIRASIPYVRQYAQAEEATVQSLQDGVITATVPRTDSEGRQYDVKVQQIEPGEVHDIPKGMEYQAPPTDPNQDSAERAELSALRACAARFRAPEWLATGRSGEGSYASALVSESPFLKAIEAEQADECEEWQDVYERVVQIEIEKGRLIDDDLEIADKLPEDTLERVQIHVVAPTAVTRKPLEEAQTNQILHDEGVKSLETWCSDAGEDWEEEKEKIRREKAEGLGKQESMLGGAGGEEKGGDDDGGNGPRGGWANRPKSVPETMGGMRQREEGAREQEEIYSEAFLAGAVNGAVSTAVALRESRDAQGHEHGGKGSGHGGQFVAKPEADTGSKEKKGQGRRPETKRTERKSTSTKSEETLKIKSAKKGERAFRGAPVELKAQLAKHESGKIGEAIIIGYLHSIGKNDARHLNLDRNNFPIDLIQDHESIEAKTGLVSNRVDAQKWRLTIGEPGKEEKERIARMSDQQKARYNARKQQAIVERKKKCLANLKKELGHAVKASTMTVLLNPDTKTADIFKFEGWHDSIRWRSEETEAAYVTTVRYG